MVDVRKSGSKGGALCVLLLEDDDADAYLTSRALKGMARVAQVVRARNGQEALAMLEAGSVVPDIAFVDLQMPTVDGLGFLSMSMDRGLASIPLVVLTSSSDWKDALRSRVQGALSVITKPENPLDLKQALQDAIDVFVPAEDPKVEELYRAPFQGSAKSEPLSADAGGASARAAPQFGRRRSPMGS